jgi:hypothetical protein
MTTKPIENKTKADNSNSYIYGIGGGAILLVAGIAGSGYIYHSYKKPYIKLVTEGLMETPLAKASSPEVTTLDVIDPSKVNSGFVISKMEAIRARLFGAEATDLTKAFTAESLVTKTATWSISEFVNWGTNKITNMFYEKVIDDTYTPNASQQSDTAEEGAPSTPPREKSPDSSVSERPTKSDLKPNEKGYEGSEESETTISKKLDFNAADTSSESSSAVIIYGSDTDLTLAQAVNAIGEGSLLPAEE